MAVIPRKFFPYLLLVLVVAAYGFSIGNGFVWDDTIFMVGNRAYSDGDLFAIFSGRASPIEYLPLRDLTVVLDYLLWGEFAPGFHLTNVLLACLTAVVVYFLCDRLLDLFMPGELPEERRGQVALVAACFFMLHPIQAQAVDFIGGRNVILGGLFFYLSLLAFVACVREPRPAGWKIYWGLSVLLFAGAMLSKATPIILPLVLLALLWCLPGRRLWFLVLPYLAVSGSFYLLLSRVATDVRIIRPEIMRFGILSLDATLAKAACIPWFYLQKILVPRGFSPEYEPLFPRSLLEPRALLAMGGLIVIVLLAARLRGRLPAVSFAILYCFATIIPVLNLLPSHTMVSDRYMFLPLLGIALAVAAAGTRVHLPGLWPLKTGAAVALVLVLVLLTAQQARMWQNEETLWQGAISSVPNCSRAYANLGSWYFSQKRYAEAFPLFEKMAELDPSKPNLEFSRGMIEYRRKHFDAALQWYRQGLRRNREHVPSLYFAGLAAMKLNEWREACGWFRQLKLSSDPDPAGYRTKSTFMAAVIIVPALTNELMSLEREIQAHPDDAAARTKHLELLYDIGRYSETVAAYRELIRRGPASAAAARMAGIASTLGGDPAVAPPLLERAAGDGDGEAAIVLARLAVRERQLRKAEALLQNAANRGNVEAACELAGLWFRLGNVAETRRWLDRADATGPEFRIRNALIRKKLDEA